TPISFPNSCLGTHSPKRRFGSFAPYSGIAGEASRRPAGGAAAKRSIAECVPKQRLFIVPPAVLLPGCTANPFAWQQQLSRGGYPPAPADSVVCTPGRAHGRNARQLNSYQLGCPPEALREWAQPRASAGDTQGSEFRHNCSGEANRASRA